MRVSPHVTTINLGLRSPARLNATYPHTPGAPSTCAYLVLLRVEIARFTQIEPGPLRVAVSFKLSPKRHGTPDAGSDLTRLCCSNPHLSVSHLRGRLIGGQRLAATLPYAVRTFLQCLVSQIAPAVVWRASPPDYQAKRKPVCGSHAKRISIYRNRLKNWPTMAQQTANPTGETPCALTTFCKP